MFFDPFFGFVDSGFLTFFFAHFFFWEKAPALVRKKWLFLITTFFRLRPTSVLGKDPRFCGVYFIVQIPSATTYKANGYPSTPIY